MDPITSSWTESVKLTRTTTVLVTDDTCAFYVQDAALIIQLPLTGVVDAEYIATTPAESSRAARLKENPRRQAAIERGRQTIASVLSEDGPLSLAKLRLQRGMSQADVAALIGTQQPAIARLEKGESDPALSTLNKLAAAFQTDIATVIQAYESAARHAR